MKNYLTVTEAARFLKLTRQAVLYAIKAGKLNAERAGRQWVIQKPEIDRAYFVNVWDSRGKLLRNPALSVAMGIERELGLYNPGRVPKAPDGGNSAKQDA